MRKWIALLVASLLLLALTPAAAQDNAFSDLARYFPDDTVLFAAFRTDPAYVDALDAQLAKLPLGTLIPRGEPNSVRALLNEALKPAGTSLPEVYAWLGDFAAFGASADANMPNADLGERGLLVAQVRNRAAAEAFFAMRLPGVERSTTEAGFTRFASANADDEGSLLIGDSVLILTPQKGEWQPSAAPLGEDRKFLNAVAALPASPYNILFYLIPSAIPQNDPQAALMFQNAGPLALGLTILDDSALVIDSAQFPGSDGAPAPSPAVNPAFARFIPSSASAVIHGHDLTNLYNNLLNLVRISQPATSDTPDPGEQLSMGLRMAGLDLQKDLLDWTTGDFAVFTRLNTVSVVDSVLQNRPDLNGSFDFGLVIEATDPAKAQALAAKLSVLINQVGAQAEGVAISSDTIGGTAVTLIRVDAPMDPASAPLSLEIVMGASDRVFFIATRPAAQAFLTEDGILANDATYQAAAKYFLPNPTSVWYTNGEGFISLTGGVGVLGLGLFMGPAIGSVFASITADLEASGTPQATPTPAPTLSPAEQMFGPGMTADRVTGLLKDFTAAVQQTSITSTITADGVTQVRLVLQLAP